MKDSFRTLPIFIGSLIILIGVLCNEWILAALLSPDGVIASPLSRMVIWFFDISLLFLGTLILIFRNSPTLKTTIKKAVFSGLTLIVTLVVIEACLHILSLFPKVDFLLSHKPEFTVSDDRLGLRPNPRHPEHDKRGFRNKSVPDEVDVIALGDSQTYGTGVKPDQAWPQQVHQLGGIKVYNMAFGGYGPVHCLILLDEALELKPKLVIEAFYAGNDLYDSYSLVYYKNQLPELKTSEKRVIRDIHKAEDVESLEDKILGMFERIFGRGGISRQFSKTRSWMEYFSEHCRIYGLFLSIKRVHTSYILKKNGVKNHVMQKKIRDSEDFQFFENGSLKTVFIPNYRLCALDLDDPRIAEGKRISLEAIRIMKWKTEVANAEFVVLLLPTKELVFKDTVYSASTTIPEVYLNLIETEELFWQRTRNYLEDQGIYFIDALPVLRRCILDGAQPYQVSYDGHPNYIGHRAIAQALLSKIEHHNLLEKSRD